MPVWAEILWGMHICYTIYLLCYHGNIHEIIFNPCYIWWHLWSGYEDSHTVNMHATFILISSSCQTCRMPLTFLCICKQVYWYFLMRWKKICKHDTLSLSPSLEKTATSDHCELSVTKTQPQRRDNKLNLPLFTLWKTALWGIGPLFSFFFSSTELLACSGRCN